MKQNTEILKEYRKQRKLLLAQIRKLKKKGIKVKDAPPIPKKITQGSINRIQRERSNLPKYNRSTKSYVGGVGTFKTPNISKAIKQGKKIAKRQKRKSQKAKSPNKKITKLKPKGDYPDIHTTGKNKVLDVSPDRIIDDLKSRINGFESIQNRTFADRSGAAGTFRRDLLKAIEEAIEQDGYEAVAKRLEDNAELINSALDSLEYFLSYTSKDAAQYASDEVTNLVSVITGKIPSQQEALRIHENLMSELGEVYSENDEYSLYATIPEHEREDIEAMEEEEIDDLATDNEIEDYILEDTEEKARMYALGREYTWSVTEDENGERVIAVSNPNTGEFYGHFYPMSVEQAYQELYGDFSV